MKPFLLLPIFILFILLAGCGEPKADLSASKIHESGAITFDYPKNWKITEDSVTSEIQNLFVESPGDALVILQSYPKDEADELMMFSKDFSENAATETPIGKVEKSKLTILPNEAGYSQIEEDFNISLFGQVIPHKRFYASKEISGRQFFLIFQVATEDYSKVKAGFHLIRDSLRSTQTAEQDAGHQDLTRREFESIMESSTINPQSTLPSGQV